MVSSVHPPANRYDLDARLISFQRLQKSRSHAFSLLPLSASPSAFMAKTHARSPSPAPNHSSLKRPKLAKTTSDPSEDFTPYFASQLFDHDNVHRLNAAYRESEPYKYAVVDKLFQDDLLHKVKGECLHQLHFTEKETDIYKVRMDHLYPSFLSTPTNYRRTRLLLGQSNRGSRVSVLPRRIPDRPPP